MINLVLNKTGLRKGKQEHTTLKYCRPCVDEKSLIEGLSEQKMQYDSHMKKVNLDDKNKRENTQTATEGKGQRL